MKLEDKIKDPSTTLTELNDILSQSTFTPSWRGFRMTSVGYDESINLRTIAERIQNFMQPSVGVILLVNLQERDEGIRCVEKITQYYELGDNYLAIGCLKRIIAFFHHLFEINGDNLTSVCTGSMITTRTYIVDNHAHYDFLTIPLPQFQQLFPNMPIPPVQKFIAHGRSFTVM